MIFTLVCIGGAILLLLLGREITCWYFKINSNMKYQEAILSALEKNNELLEKLIGEKAEIPVS